jgi:hypothetical protein
MQRSASNSASEANTDPPPPYRARDHPSSYAVMQRHQETERENWDALDPMVPLGQPVGKRFGRTDYAGYIVAYDYRSGGYVVRYEDGDLLYFPKNELDAYRNYYVIMQNGTPPPQRAPERVNPP